MFSRICLGWILLPRRRSALPRALSAWLPLSLRFSRKIADFAVVFHHPGEHAGQVPAFVLRVYCHCSEFSSLAAPGRWRMRHTWAACSPACFSSVTRFIGIFAGPTFAAARRAPRRLVQVGSPTSARWGRTKSVSESELPAAEFLSREVDPILDKISAHGIQSLTDASAVSSKQPASAWANAKLVLSNYNLQILASQFSIPSAEW